MNKAAFVTSIYDMETDPMLGREAMEKEDPIPAGWADDMRMNSALLSGDPVLESYWARTLQQQ